jgi:hypothetical protein
VSTFKLGDVVPVPMKNTEARVVAVLDHDERCSKGRECPRSYVQMVQLEGANGFPWGWFHANTLDQS